MKTHKIQIISLIILLFSVISCKKGEISSDYVNSNTDSSYSINDSISSVASMKVKNKHFIKTAQVNMEVKDVYKSTIEIEKAATELKGFVTHSNLQSTISEENTYEVSDKESIIIKKYNTENSLQVRIPTEKLAEFLDKINQHSIFLNNRTINAEDITANIQFAELEAKRTSENAKNIAQLKKNEKSISLENENKLDENQQKLNSLMITDDLKYSTVDIFIKEPNLKISETIIPNVQNVDQKHKTNFLYNIKKAFVGGFHLLQNLITWLISIWPIAVILTIGTFLWKRKKSLSKSNVDTNNKS